MRTVGTTEWASARERLGQAIYRNNNDLDDIQTTLLTSPAPVR